MKSAQEWFDEYGVSHQNKVNKLIHWICVPSIFFSIIGLLACIPHQFLDALFPSNWAPYVHFGSLFVALGSLFYLFMSRSIFVGMLVVSVLVIWGNALIENSGFIPLWLFSVLVFAAAWVGQFIGHMIEGAKPSFFKDLQFLLIGPAWLLHFVYKKVGLPI